jgi:hypothetical protein
VAAGFVAAAVFAAGAGCVVAGFACAGCEVAGFACAGCEVAGFACDARPAVSASGVAARQNATTRDMTRFVERNVMESSLS